jgi:hypothetical protein
MSASRQATHVRPWRTSLPSPSSGRRDLETPISPLPERLGDLIPERLDDVFERRAVFGLDQDVGLHAGGDPLGREARIFLCQDGNPYCVEDRAGLLFDTLRSPIMRLIVVLVFAAPAAVAGYALVRGVTEDAVPSEIWRQVFCIMGGAFVFVSALTRLAGGMGQPAK